MRRRAGADALVAAMPSYWAKASESGGGLLGAEEVARGGYADGEGAGALA